MRITIEGLEPKAEASLAQALIRLAEQAASPWPVQGSGGSQVVNIVCKGQTHAINVETMRQKLAAERGRNLTTEEVRRAIQNRAQFNKVVNNEKGPADAEAFIFDDIANRSV